MRFEPTRNEALRRLSDFVPKSGASYAKLRNFDLPGHPHVSRLSPYLRHRVITETEVVEAVLNRFAPSTAEKFIQEVYWRTYWKGWLEQRPSVWQSYRSGVKAAFNRVQTEAGLRADFEAACLGKTELEYFNKWAHELVETGYIHNHARLWFASIWIFTLRLPWELGADFFLRHLLDGDPASNTLGWRWVAGLQTRGKTYLARASNIAKYTEGRARPGAYDLAPHAVPVDGPENPPRGTLPAGETFEPERRTGLLLTEEDMSIGGIFADGIAPVATCLFHAARDRSPRDVSPRVTDWVVAALEDCCARYKPRLGNVTGPLHGRQEIAAIVDWAAREELEQIVTAYAPVGPTAEALDQLAYRLQPLGIPLRRIMRPEDRRAWPYATAGFFKFKEKIPRLIAQTLPA